MDKDLYIEFLESEIRRIRAGANQHYGQSIGWMDEIQDLKLENDRLAKRDYKMRQVIRSIACEPDCEFCLLRGSECSEHDMQLLAGKTLKELEEL